MRKRRVLLDIPRKKGGKRVAIQCRLPAELYEEAALRLKEEGVSWQALIEATVEAYSQGAVFYTPK